MSTVIKPTRKPGKAPKSPTRGRVPVKPPLKIPKTPKIRRIRDLPESAPGLEPDWGRVPIPPPPSSTEP